MDIQQLKFPIGEYTPNKNPSQQELDQWILEIDRFPNEVRNAVGELKDESLNWKYRPDGWSIKQVVHHCADSHMNSLIRFKLALTEDSPTIRPYFEDRWAELSDSLDEDITPSLLLLMGLHLKWTRLLRTLTPAQLSREYVHPEHGQTFNLAETIGNYAWHCKHHLAHIKNALSSQGSYN